MTDKAKRELKGIMITAGITVTDLAKHIGLAGSTVYRKLLRPEKFTQGEIAKIRKKLKLTDEQLTRIFFTK